MEERSSASSADDPKFLRCCMDGDAKLTDLPSPPPYIAWLFTSEETEARQFRQNTRKYNNALAFTSFRYEDGRQVSGGLQVFQVHGVLYHTHGRLLPEALSTPVYAQTWLVETGATESRMRMRPQLQEEIMRQLDAELRTCNPFINIYNTAKRRLELSQEANPELQLMPDFNLVYRAGMDRRRYNLPEVEEVAAVIGDGRSAGPRPICLSLRNPADGGNHLQRIDRNHPAYDPLHYVILFPHGDRGWSYDMRLNHGTMQRKRDGLTLSHYYRYRIAVRHGHFNLIQRGGRLFQQYVVDAWAAIEDARLRWAELNQKRIRAEIRSGLDDVMRPPDIESDVTAGGEASVRNPVRDARGRDLGKSTILPSTNTRSSRHYFKMYLNAMTLVQIYGKPTLFITFTANPRWREIVENLFPTQQPLDRPDLIAEVFSQKWRAVMQDIDDGCLGPRVAKVWVVEYQKRGLPHAHLLLWLGNKDTFLTPEGMEEIISAELPDSESDPELHTAVTTMMLHGPCGEFFDSAPCMRKNRRHEMKCSKRFPYDFAPQTVIANQGKPIYRRRQGPTFMKKVGDRNIVYTNQWVVPYNPYLLHKYNAHCNVEYCESIDAIRYVFKYIFKGGDRSGVELRSENEILMHREGRYISPVQACYDIGEYQGIHGQWPAVTQLEFHLEGQQPVYFPEDASAEEIRRRNEAATSKLIQFFAWYRDNPDSPKYRYVDFPRYFSWDKPKRRWVPRQRLLGFGRLVAATPSQGEKYCLRLLLMHVEGPKGFADIRTVDGVCHETYHAACVALGLLDDDGEWYRTFDDAVVLQSGYQLRRLFVLALTNGDVHDPSELWDRYKESICDDLPIRLEREGIQTDNEDDYLDYGMWVVWTILQTECHVQGSNYGLPSPRQDWSFVEDPFGTARAAVNDVCIDNLNADQRRCFEEFIGRVTRHESCLCFLQGSGGTGKTFVYRCLYKRLSEMGKTLVCVASSGIAAILLPYGRTAHSTFRIPIRLDESSTSSMSKQSAAAKALLDADAVIWDEAPMQHRWCFEVVDRLFRDLNDCDQLFGGIPVLLGGDFAQILPVVRKGNQHDTVSACIQRSYLWENIQIFRLNINMRLPDSGVNRQYATWLKEISSGRMNDNQDYVRLPDYVKVVTTVDALLDAVFPWREVRDGVDMTYFTGRAIMTMLNDYLQELNEAALNRFPGDTRTLYAHDEAELDVGDGDTVFDQMSREYLASLNPAELPPSVLRLKVGAPVMLIRNLLPEAGLCNGTRMTVTKIARRVVSAKILTGSFAGTEHMIPTIKLSCQGEFPFTLHRRQLPLKLCYAMTVNKSQGQSLDIVGLDLRQPAFSHGQMYVALSRVTDVSKLTVLSERRSVKNIVYKEVIRAMV